MRMVFLFTLCLLVFDNYADAHFEDSAQDDAMVVNSGEAQYDRNEIILVGEVDVQHSLGGISARKLSLPIEACKSKKKSFGLLKIEEEIHIKLKGGGELFCERAEVDYSKMLGVFTGTPAKPDVIYINSGENGGVEGGQRAPIELRSVQITLELGRESPLEGASAKIVVKRVEADQQVRISYNHDYLLLADHALYERRSAEASPLAGLLILTVGGELPACTLTNSSGDRILADKIEIDTVKRKLWLMQPRGTIHWQKECNATQELKFSAEEMMWDEQKQQMIMNGRVYIEDIMGEASSNQARIEYVIEEGRLAIKKIILEGNVRMVNRFDGHCEESSGILHYALADRVDCFTENREMILISEAPRRVLLYDRVNNIQMSAPSLKIIQDRETHKDVIKGVGDVRFTFVEKELALFKERFPLQKEGRGEPSSK